MLSLLLSLVTILQMRKLRFCFWVLLLQNNLKHSSYWIACILEAKENLWGQERNKGRKQELKLDRWGMWSPWRSVDIRAAAKRGGWPFNSRLSLGSWPVLGVAWFWVLPSFWKKQTLILQGGKHVQLRPPVCPGMKISHMTSHSNLPSTQGDTEREWEGVPEEMGNHEIKPPPHKDFQF